MRGSSGPDLLCGLGLSLKVLDLYQFLRSQFHWHICLSVGETKTGARGWGWRHICSNLYPTLGSHTSSLSLGFGVPLALTPPLCQSSWPVGSSFIIPGRPQYMLPTRGFPPWPLQPQAPETATRVVGVDSLRLRERVTGYGPFPPHLTERGF